MAIQTSALFSYAGDNFVDSSSAERRSKFSHRAFSANGRSKKVVHRNWARQGMISIEPRDIKLSTQGFGRICRDISEKIERSS